MTSTFIITEDVKDLSVPELRSKFVQISNDVARLESAGARAPLARASLQVVSRELILRRPFGVSGVPVPAGQTEALDDAIRPARDPSIVLMETPANPSMTMTDIRRAAETAHAHPARPLVMVDNTFLGPHSSTRSCWAPTCASTPRPNTCRASATSSPACRSRATPSSSRRCAAAAFGNILRPGECWILDTRLPTVSLRMNRQSKNAQRIAERLTAHRQIRRVIYPTLFDDPEQLRIFRAQCDYPGGLFSIDFHGGKPAAFTFLRHLKNARNAVSLGGVETLACHPKTTTHSGMSPAEMEEAGIGDSLVRISAGIEDWRDLLADFEHPLERI
ncbi:MAG: PLP-dependent transferase [Bryobacteraceae bacterium]